MNFKTLAALAIWAFTSLSVAPTSAVQTVSVQRDAQAVLFIQQAVTAMGGSVPADSTATGNLALLAGSLSETGTFQIMTRGTDQTAEVLQTSSVSKSVIYSRLRASETAVPGKIGLQWAITAQSPSFPLPFLIAALQNSDTAFQYLGQESLNNLAAQHIRVWNTFSSQPALAGVAKFSVQDIWLDASSQLPLKISCQRRHTASADTFLVETFFSDYRNVSGYLYPFSIKKSLNGGPWLAMSVQNVAFNTGLSDNDFPIQ